MLVRFIVCQITSLLITMLLILENELLVKMSY